MNKNTQKIIIGVLIALVLLLLIWWKTNSEQEWMYYFEDFKNKFQSEEKGLIVLILLLAPVSWLIESFKWRFLLHKVQKISLWTSFASVLTGMSFAIISPGKSADFAGRILYLKPNTRLRGVIASLVGSFAHILVTFFMALLGFSILLTRYQDWKIWALFATVLLSGLGITIFYFRINRFQFKAKNRKSWWGKFLLALRVLKRYDQKDLLKVLLFSLLKFCCYTTQFVLVTYVFGSKLGFGISFFTASAMFWMIMVVPSMIISDIIVRGAVAHFLFVRTGIISDNTPVLAGSYLIWFTNWVVPSLSGAFILMIHRIFFKEQVQPHDKEE